MNTASTRGFTLIELSIVLVIIGLIVGGILTGQSLISAATVRAQITQIEKYNTAANTFYGKYGYLPGDIPATAAAQFGFASRGALRGEGDGNGILEGIEANTTTGYDDIATYTGEEAMFWVDLSAVNMIDGSFTTATSTALPGIIPITNLGLYFPAAKLGNGNYVMVGSGGWSACCGAGHQGDGQNYFFIDDITNNTGSGLTGYDPYGNTTITPAQAYAMDSKTDDGNPQTGRVMALNIGGYYGIWSAGSDGLGAKDPTTNGPVVAGDGVATSASANTCYDNGGVAGATEHYSIGYKSGSNPTCALAFRLQSGD